MLPITNSKSTAFLYIAYLRAQLKLTKAKLHYSHSKLITLGHIIPADANFWNISNLLWAKLWNAFFINPSCWSKNFHTYKQSSEHCRTDFHPASLLSFCLGLTKAEWKSAGRVEPSIAVCVHDPPVTLLRLALLTCQRGQIRGFLTENTVVSCILHSVLSEKEISG